MILIFETHPVQYRVPLYREVSQLLGSKNLKVIYGSDFSVKAYEDVEFGSTIDWGMDLLSGYSNEVLGGLNEGGLSGFWSLRGTNVSRCFEGEKVTAVVLTSLNYAYDFRVYFEAKRRGIPVLLRTETQDWAFKRNWFKNIIRSILYRVVYSGIEEGFPIGRLNSDHYEKHGLRMKDSSMVRYCVPSFYNKVSRAEKEKRRLVWREVYGIPANTWLVGFSGKLIEKKDPMLVLQSLREAKAKGLKGAGVVIVGTGELEAELKAYALEHKLPVWFVGFLNQESIIDAYLAMDCLMLPSKQMGETWGLVVNEALQAGCSVILSEYVGSSVEFGRWERVRTISSNNEEEGSDAMMQLAQYDRSWDWCQPELESYSIKAVAIVYKRKLEGYISLRKKQGDEE